MARTWYGRRVADPAPPARSALTAAAVSVQINNPPSQVLWGGAAWQQEAWAHYDTCPELHAAAGIYGSAFSRAKLIAVDVDPVTFELGTEPTDDRTATALAARLFGGPTGRAQAQKQIGIHLTVAGECWVLATDRDPDVDGQTWRILSVSEVTKAGNQIQIQQLDGTQRILQDGELLFRMFNPHPKRAWEADSPTRALLPVFRELAGLTAQITASIKSRLATGGVWLLPQSAKLPTSIEDTLLVDPGTVDEADKWMRLLTDAMVAAISDPNSAAAMVPIIAMIPDEILEKVKDPIKFVQDIMTEAQTMRAACTQRIAVGMDMPAELLTGVGQVNHWGQWFIDESFVTGPLATALSLPADAFTSHYLRVGIRISGGNPSLFAMTFDTDDMIADANETNAQNAYAAGVLSEEAYLQALHFDPLRDAAPVDERLRRLLLTILERGNPESLAELGPTLVRYFPGLTLAPLSLTPAGQPAGGPPAIEAPTTTQTQSPPPTPTAPPSSTPPGP